MLTVVFCIFSDILDHSPDHTAVQLGDDVTGVYIDGTDGHDLLTVSRAELANQHANQGIQLLYLDIYKFVHDFLKTLPADNLSIVCVVKVTELYKISALLEII